MGATGAVEVVWAGGEGQPSGGAARARAHNVIAPRTIALRLSTQPPGCVRACACVRQAPDPARGGRHVTTPPPLLRVEAGTEPGAGGFKAPLSSCHSQQAALKVLLPQRWRDPD